MIEEDHVIVRKTAEPDAPLGAFLNLLKRDMTTHPERLQGMPRALLMRMRALVAGVAIDHEEHIDGAVAL
jgi:hypothetical protein